MQPNITEKVDIWSLGTTLFFIAAFQSVWISSDYASIVAEIKHGKIQRLPDRYSCELDGFIARCLQVDPMYRPSILELLLEPQINDVMRSVCEGLFRLCAISLGYLRSPSLSRPLCSLRSQRHLLRQSKSSPKSNLRETRCRWSASLHHVWVAHR